MRTQHTGLPRVPRPPGKTATGARPGKPGASVDARSDEARAAMKPERVMGIAAALIATGIGIGALGSHALRAVLSPRQTEALATAVEYQLLNALGLLLLGLLMKKPWSPACVALRWH